jgi:hypothetical protein
MMDWNDEPDRASVDKIVNHLRTPVSLDETFDVRVMSAVHAAALAQVDAQHVANESSAEADAPWWRKRYTLHLSAWSGLALAASIFGIMLIGATVMSRTVAAPAVQTAAVARPADARNVSFILVDDSARQVWLVGDFNGWSRKQLPLTRAANGRAWTVSVSLQEGRHEYAFIVADENGEHWVADPLTQQVEDDFGTTSSIVRVEATS